MAILTETRVRAGTAPEALRWRAVSLRLFLTCWAVYALHASPYVVRELYLTMSLAEHSSVRVDEYVDLHPDLFEIPARGAFLGGNPGVAFLAAVPYKLALPLLTRLAPVRPRSSKDAATYKEQRPNRLAFYRKVRERGLDLRLGAAAMFSSVFFMAPLAAFSAVVVFGILTRARFTQKESLWLALLYAFGTPVFFRAAIMNQNFLVALLGLFAFALLWRPAEHSLPTQFAWRSFAAGLLAGYAVFTDYTGVVTIAALGLFLLVQETGEARLPTAAKSGLPFVVGALIPVGFLLAYQWYCFGSPWWPAQYYMPREIFRGYSSEYGFGVPRVAALWSLLFDPLYGLFVFAPILALVFYHPVLIRQRANRVHGRVAMLAWLLSMGIWVFCAAIHFTLRHQWQDGVRYMMPVVPFLFLLAADVLARMPRGLTYILAAGVVFESWCLAMVREAPLVSISRVVHDGLELPWLTALVNTAPQYFPALEKGASPLPLFVILILLIGLLWRTTTPRKVNA